MSKIEEQRDTPFQGTGADNEILGSREFDTSSDSSQSQRAVDKLGQRLQGVAGKIRDTGPRIENIVHRATETIAGRLEQGGSYLKEKKYQPTGSATSWIKQHPVASMLVGVVVGVMLASGSRRH